MVNAPNEGAIPNLPHDAIVEVNAVVNGYGIRPVAVEPLHPALAAHLQGWISFEQHVVQAALSGSKADLFRAFLLDPNTSANLTLEETERDGGGAGGGERGVGVNGSPVGIRGLRKTSAL